MLETLARVQAPHKKQFDPNLDDPNLQIQQQMQLNACINKQTSSVSSIEGTLIKTPSIALVKTTIVDQSVIEELKKTIIKLMTYAKKHPKSVALWTEIAQLKDKYKIESTSNNSEMLLKLSIASDGARSKANSVDSIDVMHTYIQKTAESQKSTHAKTSSVDADLLQAALITLKSV